MNITTCQIDTNAPDGILSALRQTLRAHPGAQFISLHANADLDIDALRRTAAEAAPQAALHGATSCLGTMTQDGHQTAGAAGLGLFILSDEEGDYGTALAPLGDDPVAAADDATRRALAAADRPGEVPELIWISATPGQSEHVLRGIQRVVGTDVPIIGGSAADNSVAGGWSVFDRDAMSGAGVTVSVLFPSTQISFAYQNGYVPTDRTGIVTRVEGRILYEIDGRPAAEVYGDWSRGHVIPKPVSAPANILSDSTLWPLGRPVSKLGNVPYFLLAHPATVRPDGALELFATVTEGETLVQMTGDVDILASRAGRVAGLAREAGAMPRDRIAGALMVYCGGCMLAVRDRMDRVVGGVTDELPDIPFLGMFTFGEQGNILNVGNRHGNLMISCILFAR